jgi:hypothetical protein
MSFNSDYVNQLRSALAEMSRIMDTTIFTGWLRGYFEEFSRCCSALTHCRSMMEGIPYCSKCGHSLGPDDLRYEWVPPRALGYAQEHCPWPTEPPETR